MSGAKAFGVQSPTQGETAVSWQTWSDGSAGIPSVQGDANWGKLELDLSGEEGRSAVYDLGSTATRKFTLTENRYGTGQNEAFLQYRTSTTAFNQDDVLPAWTEYSSQFSVSCRYVQIRETTIGGDLGGHYVATDGDDGHPGTYAEPWATFAHAVSQMTAGETLYIRGGTYTEQLALSSDGGGTAGNVVTYRNYPGETVTIDGTELDVSGEALVFLTGSSGADYVVIDGIRAINSNYIGIRAVDVDHLTIRNCYTYNTQISGIHISVCTNVLVYNNEIELANVLVNGYEENLSIEGGSSIEVSYNYVHDGNPDTAGGGEGINVKAGAHDIIVHHNTVANNPKYAFGVDAWSSHTYTIKFYNNLAYNCAYGYIVESEDGGLCEDIWVYNNIAYDMDRTGTYEQYAGLCMPNWGSPSNGVVDHVYFINNTIFNCNYGFWQRTSKAANVIIRNNIFSNCGNNPQISLVGGEEGHFTIDHNLFDTPNTAVGTDYVQGDPLFASEITPNFHIGDGSPAIAAGSTTNAPTDDYDSVSRGAEIDIGAYEHV